MAVIVGVGLAIRLAYVLIVKGDEAPRGDAITYFLQGHQVASGDGLVNAPLLAFRHISLPAADHPPLFTYYLALLDLLGIRTFLGARLGVAVMGLGTIVVVGLVGRRIAGDRAGLLAAAIAAVSPLVWVNDGQILSESMTMLCVAAAILFAYRFWERPDWGRAALFGAACGLAALGARRDPAHGAADRRPAGLRHAPVDGAPAPRVTCRRGDRGSRRVRALGDPQHARVRAPGSVRDQPGHHAREHELREHLLRAAPRVVGPGVRVEPEPDARPVAAGPETAPTRAGLRRRPPVARPGGSRRARGRLWGVFRPLQTVDLMRDEGRERAVGIMGLLALYASVPLGIAGAVILRRRRIPISPLVAPVFVATLSAMLAFGNPRYRASADIALVVLSAIALDALVLRWTRRHAPAEPAGRAECGAVDAADDPFAAEGLH